MSASPAPSALPIFKVGLTGGIATGKSLIRNFLHEEGVPTIDADDIVHELLANDTTLKTEIRQEFGDDVFFEDGSINRKALGTIVFNNEKKRRQLENWIHPKTRLAVTAFFQAQQDAGHAFAIALIPLLFESNLEPFYDAVWLVHSTTEQQIERLKTYRNFTEDEALQRIQSQMPYEQKRQSLHLVGQWAVIENSGTPNATQKQIQRLVQDLRATRLNVPIG